MKILLGLTIGIVAIVCLAPATFARPVAHNSSIAVVQQYLRLRNSGRLKEAQALFAWHRKVIIRAGSSDWINMDLVKVSAVLPAVAAFYDPRSRSGYRFHVLNTAPDNPLVVLVSARLPEAAKAVTLQIATIRDPADGAAPRLDQELSMARTDVRGWTKLQTNSLKMSGITQKPLPIDMSLLQVPLKLALQQAFMFNLKQLGIAEIQYEQNSDERFPEAARWVDQLLPFVTSKDAFRETTAPVAEKWSFAYNRNLSGKNSNLLANPAATVMFFESNSNRKNASDTGQSVPRPGRHDGGSYYVFADGRVKWLKDGTKPSFSFNGK